MKIDKDIIAAAMAEGMPAKPMPDNFSDEESFEEAYGFWMERFGRVLALRQQARNREMENGK